jgi:hypothetical protein
MGSKRCRKEGGKIGRELKKKMEWKWNTRRKEMED